MQCPQFRKGDNKLEGIQEKSGRIPEVRKTKKRKEKKRMSGNKLRKIIFLNKKNIKQEINQNS